MRQLAQLQPVPCRATTGVLGVEADIGAEQTIKILAVGEHRRVGQLGAQEQTLAPARVHAHQVGLQPLAEQRAQRFHDRLPARDLAVELCQVRRHRRALAGRRHAVCNRGELRMAGHRT